MRSPKLRLVVPAVILFFVIVVGATLVIKALLGSPTKEIPPPNTLIVSKAGEGQYKTISEALKNAQPNMRILVRPGVYEEKVIVDKPVEIIGDPNGTEKQIIIETRSSSCMLISAKNITVRGLSMRLLPGIKASIFKFFQVRNTVEEPCVDITEGQTVIEDCDITSEAVAGIGVRGDSADPVIRRTKIHNGNSNGIWVINHARATVQECDIWGTAWAALRIEGGANAILQRCRVYDVRNCGMVITNYARGTVDECEFFNNALSGIEVRERSSLNIRKSKIHHSKEQGVWFHKNSTGEVEGCEIYSNGMVGIEITEDSSPTISHCEVFSNSSSNVEVNRGADPVIRDCKIHGGPGSGIFVYENGRGTIENCEISDHQKYQQIAIRSGSSPVFRRCKVYSGMAGGVLVMGDSTGTLEDCDIYDNRSAGIWIRQNSNPTIRSCKINRNGLQAIVVNEGGSATVEQSDLTGNLGGAWDIQPQCAVRSTRNKE